MKTLMQLFTFKVKLPTDKKLLRVCRSYRKGLLDGMPSTDMCGMMSHSLQGYLSFFEHVETEVIEGSFMGQHHVWLKMEDGRIIDATADQFKDIAGNQMPDVYIGPHRNEYEP